MGDIKLIVGLGNPGQTYEQTRHNTGFKVIDSLAEVLKIDVRKKKFGARYGLGEWAGKKLILLKPWQFMNRSGQAVATASGFYKLDASDLLVVTDDMDIEPGRIRFRSKGSAGGHNGLADIIDKLGTNEFARCRIGIGRSDNADAVDYVLNAPPKNQMLLLADAIERARDGALCWIEFGINPAMNKFNISNE
jgi:PTH1 family peptidyl-tRNA hydrolase